MEGAEGKDAGAPPQTTRPCGGPAPTALTTGSAEVVPQPPDVPFRLPPDAAFFPVGRVRGGRRGGRLSSAGRARDVPDESTADGRSAGTGRNSLHRKEKIMLPL